MALVADGAAQPPIRIGASVSQTGAYAPLGQNLLRGYQLCIKHTSDKAGVLGRRLELAAEDDRSEPATAARIYEKLITQDKVEAVIGPYSSPITEPRGLSVILVEAYPKGATDFSAMLTRVRKANPDVLAAATYFDDAAAITRQLKAADVNPRMFGVTIGADLPKFYEMLGGTAGFVYGPAAWEPELMALLRAGELVPLARRYPGAREFVESHRKAFPGADLSYHSAAGYGGCQVLVEAIKRAGSLEGDKVRAAILAMNLNTVYGGFKVDRDGIQTAHTMLTFQRQDGKKVIVWPDELAPGKPRFPTPPWSRRP
jgi:branched-chain amino acid transport system substrate-binding protein